MSAIRVLFCLLAVAYSENMFSQLFGTPADISPGIWREVFPQRQNQQLSVTDMLPQNMCAPDMLSRASWAFRRRNGSITRASSTTNVTAEMKKIANEGDWLRYTGQLVIDCRGECKHNVTLHPEASDSCFQNLSISNFAVRTNYTNNFFYYRYRAMFVLEYRYSDDESSLCGVLVPSSTSPTSDIQINYFSKEFSFSDPEVNDTIVSFFNGGLSPLLQSLGLGTIIGPFARPILSVRDFCSLAFIQCLSIPIEEYAFHDFTNMYPFYYPSMYSTMRSQVNVNPSVFDSGNITGYALLLGGSPSFSLANFAPGITTPVNWNGTENAKFLKAIDAMFLLDLSFNPNLRLALNAPSQLRVLLLSGSPQIDLQYTAKETPDQGNMFGVKNVAPSCSIDYCARDDQTVFNFSAAKSGAHPVRLKVLSLTVDRAVYDKFFLRNFPELVILQVDDSTFSYPGVYESVFSINRFSSSLPSQVSDNWPKSVIPKYDISCRDMYERYYDKDLDTNFNFACSGFSSLKYFSVFGLPVNSFGPRQCFSPEWKMLQVEGSLLEDAAELFRISDIVSEIDNGTTGEGVSSNSTVDDDNYDSEDEKLVRLAHNVRLTDISVLLQLPIKNLLIYGSQNVSFDDPKTANSLIEHIDASFSDVLSKDWTPVERSWGNVTKLTCRKCKAKSWPPVGAFPLLAELRLPMNVDLSFNMNNILSSAYSVDPNGDAIKKADERASKFFLDFDGSELDYLDVSYCKIRGFFPKNHSTVLPFPNKVSFAYNYLKSYHDGDLLFPDTVLKVFGRTKSIDLRGNLFVGPEPDWFYNVSILKNNTNRVILDVSSNQVSCSAQHLSRDRCMFKQTPLCGREKCGNEYCSWRLFNSLPRTVSSFESSAYSVKMINSSLADVYNSFVSAADCSVSSNSGLAAASRFPIQNLSSPTCIDDFCAFLAFADDTFIVHKKFQLDFSKDYLEIDFVVDIAQNTKSRKCIQQQRSIQQMPLLKDSFITSCEAQVDLYFGNKTHIQKYMSLPSVMLVAQCGEGRFFIMGNCMPCPKNTYREKPEIDQFDLANDQCLPCPFFSTTAGIGSTSRTECTCEDGKWGDPLNCPTNQTDCCRPCPDFAECVRANNTFPVANDGYILDQADKSKVLECIPHLACKQGVCTSGYMGNGCSKCEAKHYRLQQACVKCPSADGFVIFLGVLVFVFGCLFLLKGSKPEISKIYTISITVGFVQIISIFASFPVQWPTEATMMFDIFSFVNFNIDLFSPECALELDFYAKWGLKMAMPLMLFVFFVVIFGVVRFVPCVRKYYIKFLLWKMVDSVVSRVPPKYRVSDLKQLRRLQGKNVDVEEDEEGKGVNGQGNDKGQEMVVVRKMKSVPSMSIDPNASQMERVSFGVEKVSPLSAAEQYEIDREWEETHLSSRFVHACVATCCLAYTFLAKTSTQIFNCVDVGGVTEVIRYDPSVACYDEQWQAMQVPAVFALIVYTFGIPLFFSVILLRASHDNTLETPEFFAHFGQLVLPYRSQYWYWEVVQIFRKLLTVLLIDFAADAQGENTYSQITGVFVVLLIFLVLQEFIKPYEFTWCNRLAFAWTAISLMVVVSALFFVQSTLTSEQRSDYGIGLLISCIIGFGIALYTAKLENSRASAKTQVTSGKDFLTVGQEEQTVVNTIFGKSIGEPLYRKTRGLHPTTRAAFYQQLVKLHSSSSEADMSSSCQAPEVEIAQLRVRLSQLESKSSERPSSLDVSEQHPSRSSFTPGKPPPLTLLPVSASSSSPPPYVTLA